MTSRRLVGRDEEVARVTAIVRRLAAERSGRDGIVIEAAPGMGASSLAAVADAEAVAASLPLVRVHGADDTAVAAVRAAQPGPVVVVIERLDRADGALIGALDELEAAAVVATTRRTVTLPGVPVTVLDPLDAEAVGELVRQELGAACGPTLDVVLRGAEGAPAVLVELLAALQREARIVVEDGVADVASDELPSSVRDAVVRYLGERLLRSTFEVVQIGAALGQGTDVADLALVLGRPVSEVAAELQRSRRALDNELARASLYEALAPAVRAALHAEIASVFAAAGKHPREVARHVIAADGIAAPTIAADVAWALRREEPAVVLEVCRTMFGAGIADAGARDRLLAASCWPRVTHGRLEEAIDAVRELRGRPHDRALDVELTWCHVAALQRLGRAEEGREELLQLLDRDDLEPDARRWLQARLPGAHLFAGDLAAAERVAEKLVAGPGADGDLDIARAVASPRVFARLARGDVAGAVAVAEEAEAIGWQPQRPTEGVAVAYPIALVEADRFDEARRALREAARVEDGLSEVALLSVYDIWLVVIDVLAGTWDDASAAAEGVFDRMTSGGTTVSAPWALAYPAVMHLRRGDADRAEAFVLMAERVLETTGAQNGADVVLWARALVHDTRDATHEAASLLAREWDATATTRYFVSWRSVAPDLVRLAMATGDRARAAAVVEDAEEGARRAPAVPSVQGAALRCRGLLDGDPDALVAAFETLRRGPRRPDTAAAAHEAGVALAAAGRRADAVAALELARVLSDAIGATRDVRRIESRLATLGAAPRRRRGPGAPGTGWDSLSARELEVIELVADGLTNPQVAERMSLSRHTVESHLKRVFLKLGIGSRAQLAAEALRRRPY